MELNMTKPLMFAFGMALLATSPALAQKPDKIRVGFVKEDSKMTVETGQQAANKLIESDQVDVLVGNMMSNLLLAYVGPTTKQGKIILSGVAGPSKLAGEDCNPNVFVYSWENNS